MKSNSCNQFRNPGGRPKKEEWVKRKFRLPGIRLNTDELLKVKSAAKAAGLQVTDYVRQCIVNGVVQSRLSSEEMKAIRKMIGMANNLNQLAHQANAAGYTSDAALFHDCADMLSKQIIAIKL